MAYHIDRDEMPSVAVKRIVLEQVDAAIRHLQNPVDETLTESIHEARKSFKKIRAVLRLVRPEMEGNSYRLENTAYRDAGRQLSGVRDCAALIETLNRIKDSVPEGACESVILDLRNALETRYESMKQKSLVESRILLEVLDWLGMARERIATWPIEKKDFRAFAEGLRRTYRRGRKTFRKAYAEPTPENFHEWRKQAKYLWYQIRILRPIWKSVLGDLSVKIHDLSGLLGDLHDLEELRKVLENEPGIIAQDRKELLEKLIEARSRDLRKAARVLGDRIYLEKPMTFRDRIDERWRFWWDRR